MRLVHFPYILYFLHDSEFFIIKLLCNLQSLDEKAQKALECPCIADLRNGPCGIQFSDAFLCFLKSAAEEQVSVMNY